MTVIPRQVEYALLALAEMDDAAPGEVFAVRGLCRRNNVPFDVMARALQRLQRAGVVRAVRGVQGGYQLSRPAERVTVLELYEALAGPLRSVRCLDEVTRCPRRGRCGLVGAMQFLDGRLREMYRTISLSQLLESRGRPRRGSDGVRNDRARRRRADQGDRQ